MSRTILIALFISTIILVSFAYGSQQYRAELDHGPIVPTAFGHKSLR